MMLPASGVMAEVLLTALVEVQKGKSIGWEEEKRSDQQMVVDVHKTQRQKLNISKRRRLSSQVFSLISYYVQLRSASIRADQRKSCPILTPLT